MAMCDVCGKGPSFGNKKEERGKPKYLGGNGRKTTGITRRMFRPNIQRVRVDENGQTVRKSVCVQCLRSGNVAKAIKRKLFTLPSV